MSIERLTWMYVHTSVIHNSQKMKTIQMIFNKEGIKSESEYFWAIKKEWTVDT